MKPKRRCQKCREQIGRNRCTGCKQVCGECLFDDGRCYVCRLRDYRDACRFTARSSGQVFYFKGFEKEESEITVKGFVRNGDHPMQPEVGVVSFPFYDTEPIAPVEVPRAIRPWRDDWDSGTLAFRGRCFQVVTLLGVLWAFENGIGSDGIIVLGETIGELRDKIDHELMMQRRFGEKRGEVCCKYAKLIDCRCWVAYSCPLHGTHHFAAFGQDVDCLCLSEKTVQ